MANILKKIIENDKGEIRKLEKMADKVMSYEDEMAALTDEELQAKTVEFKERYANGETLDQLLFEAFAVVREGAKRVLGLFPYKVQIMGGIVLHHGDVPEMRNLAKEFTLLQSMNTCPSVMRLRWVNFILGWDFLLVST